MGEVRRNRGQRVVGSCYEMPLQLQCVDADLCYASRKGRCSFATRFAGCQHSLIQVLFMVPQASRTIIKSRPVMACRLPDQQKSSKEVWKLNFRQYGQMKKPYSSAEGQTWRKSEAGRCRYAKRWESRATLCFSNLLWLRRVEK